eukprot:3085500-Ditylum_brightwellii.AAC.1
MKYSNLTVMLLIILMTRFHNSQQDNDADTDDQKPFAFPSDPSKGAKKVSKPGSDVANFSDGKVFDSSQEKNDHDIANQIRSKSEN